jgi:hypothetical protein
MGLAFGYFNGFWWFFCFKNSGFVFNWDGFTSRFDINSMQFIGQKFTH